MKYLVKLFIVVIALTMATGKLSAQRFGLKGGLNFSNMLVKDDNTTLSDNYDMKLGYHIGATVEFSLSKMFSFEAGLLLATKGYKADYDILINNISGNVKSEMNFLYLDIPLTAKAAYDLGGAKIYGVLGPYLGIGLSGHAKTELSDKGVTETHEEDIEWGDSRNEVKRLDYGLTIGAGVEINSFDIGISYGLGFANAANDNDNDNGITAKHRVLCLSVGYKFGK